MWVRCIFVNARLRGKKPVNPAYPIELITLGDHLRKTRLERGLSQLQVAKLFKVTPDTVTGWELNRHDPPARYVRPIILFLGYLPFKQTGNTVGKKLHFARLIAGMTQEQVAVQIGCDESNLRYIELDQRTPGKITLSKIDRFIEAVLASYNTNPS